jgi:hypothetical protein
MRLRRSAARGLIMRPFFTTLPTLDKVKLVIERNKVQVQTHVPPRIEAHAMRLGNAAHWYLVCWRVNMRFYF